MTMSKKLAVLAAVASLSLAAPVAAGNKLIPAGQRIAVATPKPGHRTATN
jgi:hypothetical protein